MKTAIVKLKSLSPYSQRRFHQTPKLPKELHDDYEKRTWRESCNYLTDGRLFIPQMAFKNALSDVAKFLGEKIPGRKNATWTSHFERGLQIEDDLILPVTKDEVEGEWRHVPSDGKPGGSSRVLKCFPTIQEWEGELTFYIIDDTITEEVFHRYLNEAGKFVGVGVFRPQKRGFFGRFKVVDIVWG